MLRSCIDCGVPTPDTRCPKHAKAHKKVRNDNRARARAVVAAEPWCHCRNRACGHPGECRSMEDLTSGHVMPLDQGGAGDGPQVPECRSCNSRKGARLPAGGV